MSSSLRPILLVDDDANDVELAIEALKEGGVANPVVVARDGVEALRLLGEGRDHGATAPVVVLLDVKMPRMGGLEMLERVKSDEQLKRLPVVIMTSSGAEPDVERAYQLGANAYVVKPVNFRDFVETVKVVGQFWAVLNETPSK